MGRACKGREMGRGPLTEGRPGSGGKRRRRGWGRRFSPPGRLDDGRNGQQNEDEVKVTDGDSEDDDCGDSEDNAY
ncbi:hypothetical protein CRG98_042645 [Punica granatum]|uniref:Uncharacterized protein n=1 Tax=Punica granatum TaxID=22663 RepID=A0A2I0HYZ9_PUNGR|nr:hypothetical protein CRG98_042645 [Punica granatum]